MHPTKPLPLHLLLSLSTLTLLTLPTKPTSQCVTNSKRGCPLSLASYYIPSNTNLTFISTLFSQQIPTIISYNPNTIPDKDRIPSFSRINIPFPCNNNCMATFTYTTQKGDTYDTISQLYYSNLTTPDVLAKFNAYPSTNIPIGAAINVTINCFCGDAKVDKRFGLFLTYPLRVGESLESVAKENNLTGELLMRFNPGVDFGSGSGIVFIPAKDKDGKYPPLISSKGLSGGIIAGICVATVAVIILSAAVCFVLMRRKRMKKASLLSSAELSLTGARESSHLTKSSSLYTKDAAGNLGMTVDKSLEFSYEELAQATDNFSMANKIGSGGFGAVYFAELRGEKAAVKKMEMQASKEFLAELNVLTRVHHLNLVRLIGYCVEEWLFVVYEYVENGNLSQHLRGSGRDPLPWSTRVQIALDAARGLEYIHEHTVPVYVHRDIKSANILIDENFHAKVADFGLTKLTEVGAASAPTRLVGTFGYMAPEYAQYGEVSPKVDVYAFGVVLYELISAKEAVMKDNASLVDSKGLVGLFEGVLNKSNLDNIRDLVDPKLEDSYPFDSVVKMAQLAKSCTHENPGLRPSMRSVVVALMTLSSTTEEWDAGALRENRGLTKLLSGR